MQKIARSVQAMTKKPGLVSRVVQARDTGAAKRILLDALIEKRNAVAKQAVETLKNQQAGTER